MAVEPELMTAEELLRLPRGSERHELVRGELRTMPLNDWPHGIVASECTVSLGNYVRTHQLGPLMLDAGFQLTVNPDTVRGADVAFVRRERVPTTGLPTGYWPGAPDLAVEVISSSDLYVDIDEKVAEWLEYGTRLVFVVNPRRCTVAVHRPGQPVRILVENDVLDGEDVVPGWTLPVRELFEQV